MKRAMLLLALTAAACGGSEPIDGDPAGQPDAGGDRTRPDARPSNPGSCNSTEECSGGTVCDPATHACVASLTCAKNEDCGTAAYCDTAKSCAPATTGSPCTGDSNCISGETCQEGGLCGCGGSRYEAKSVPPNILIVLDRSGSMDEPTGGDGSPSKWTAAKDAVNAMLTTYNAQVRFGLSLYPGTNNSCSSGGSCRAGAIFSDVAANGGPAISTALGRVSTCTGRGFGTPTGEAIAAMVDYDGLEDTTRANYVVLITDGGHTESCLDPTAPVANLRKEKPEIKTFVIGFGGGIDATELTDLANAGGTARAGATKYYVAGDAASLELAFKDIVGSVVSCSYALSETPPDPNLLYVYRGTTQVSRDTNRANGWDYDATANQVVLYGAACEALRAPAAGDLSIVYGCPLDVD